MQHFLQVRRETGVEKTHLGSAELHRVLLEADVEAAVEAVRPVEPRLEAHLLFGRRGDRTTNFTRRQHRTVVRMLLDYSGNVVVLVALLLVVAPLFADDDDDGDDENHHEEARHGRYGDHDGQVLIGRDSSVLRAGRLVHHDVEYGFGGSFGVSVITYFDDQRELSVYLGMEIAVDQERASVLVNGEEFLGVAVGDVEVESLVLFGVVVLGDDEADDVTCGVVLLHVKRVVHRVRKLDHRIVVVLVQHRHEHVGRVLLPGPGARCYDDEVVHALHLAIQCARREDLTRVDPDAKRPFHVVPLIEREREEVEGLGVRVGGGDLPHGDSGGEVLLDSEHVRLLAELGRLVVHVLHVQQQRGGRGERRAALVLRDDGDGQRVLLLVVQNHLGRDVARDWVDVEQLVGGAGEFVANLAVRAGVAVGGVHLDDGRSDGVVLGDDGVVEFWDEDRRVVVDVGDADLDAFRRGLRRRALVGAHDRHVVSGLTLAVEQRVGDDFELGVVESEESEVRRVVEVAGEPAVVASVGVDDGDVRDESADERVLRDLDVSVGRVRVDGDLRRVVIEVAHVDLHFCDGRERICALVTRGHFENILGPILIVQSLDDKNLSRRLVYVENVSVVALRARREAVDDLSVGPGVRVAGVHLEDGREFRSVFEHRRLVRLVGEGGVVVIYVADFNQDGRRA